MYTTDEVRSFLTSLIELLSPPMLSLLADDNERVLLQQWYFDLLLDISKRKLSVGTYTYQSRATC